MRLLTTLKARPLIILLIVVCLMGVSGCATKLKDKTLDWSVQQLYFAAKEKADSGSFASAKEYYHLLLARYPSSRYAQQSQLDLIAVNYRDGNFEQAAVKADEFIKLYPNSPHANYARYMRGIIAYYRDISIFDKIIPTDLAQVDQTRIDKAYDSFSALVANSPASKYAADARQQMIYLRNLNAEHEIYIAEYYLYRGAYLAAANRGKYVLENYPQSSSIPLALAVMIRAYQALKLNDLAMQTQRVLAFNYPDEDNHNPRLHKILHGDGNKGFNLWNSLKSWFW